MTASQGCFQKALDLAKGRLTPEEISAAFDNEQKIRAAFIQSGQTDNLDARVARKIVQQTENAKAEAARMKRQVERNIIVRKNLKAAVGVYMAEGLSPIKAMRTLWQGTVKDISKGRMSGDALGAAYKNRWMGDINARVTKEKPHIFKLLDNKKFDNDVTRELFELRDGGQPGATNNRDAQWFAKVIATTMETARTDMNRLGAAIGKLDGYAGPQIHDDVAMLRVPKQKWIDDIFPLLDADRSFPDAVDKAEIVGILDRVYDTIVTGVDNDISPTLKGQPVGPANMAKSLGKHRVLHFKNADASIKYTEIYGRGSTIQGIFSMLNHQSRMAGAMDTFGPNPRAMILSLAEQVQKDLKEQVSTLPPGKKRDTIVKHISKLDARGDEIPALAATMNDLTGLSSRPVNTTAAKIGDGIRATQALAKLGGAVITAIPSDLVTVGAASMFRNQGFWNGIFKTLGEMRNIKNGQVSAVLNEGFEGFMGHLSAANMDYAPGKIAQAMTFFFKVNGLSGWTDTVRAASSRMIAHSLSLSKKLSFDKLDPAQQSNFRQTGITPEKWNAIRSAGVMLENGKEYITPDLIRNVPDNLIEPIVADRLAAVKPGPKADATKARIINEGRVALELDLHRYYAEEMAFHVVKADASTRAFTNQGFSPGTIHGEAIRFFLQFKGFPHAFTRRILGGAIHNAPNGNWHRSAHIATIIGGMTVAGYMSIMIKDSMRGNWPPRNPFDPKTWMAAFLQGGSLGIYGDFLFGGESRFGHGPIETLGGPSVGALGDIWAIYTAAREGDVKAGKALDFAVNNTPFANLFYVRPALDILFLNSLRELAKPGTIDKRRQRRKEEYGQDNFLPQTLF